MWSLYSDRQTLPGKGSPSPKTSSLPAQCQLCASPALAPLTVDSISFTPPLPQIHRIQWGSVWFTSTVLSVSITFNVNGRAVQVDILHSQIELLTFLIFFSPINCIFYHLISPFRWVLCQIWGDSQGQIHPHSPQLALTPVTRVFGRGRRFHAGCTICPVFTLLSICITDSRHEWHQHEATVTECYWFFGWVSLEILGQILHKMHAWFHKMCVECKKYRQCLCIIWTFHWGHSLANHHPFYMQHV